MKDIHFRNDSIIFQMESTVIDPQHMDMILKTTKGNI